MKLIRNRLYYYVGYYAEDSGIYLRYIDSPYVSPHNHLFYDSWGKHYILHKEELINMAPLYLHELKRKFK
jgi:hypothetical protein